MVNALWWYSAKMHKADAPYWTPINHTHANKYPLKGEYIHRETITHTQVTMDDQSNISQFNPHNISSLSPWPRTIPLSWSLTLHNPTESYSNCSLIMEIELWLQICEISHTECQQNGACQHALDGKQEPFSQVSLSAEHTVHTRRSTLTTIRKGAGCKYKANQAGEISQPFR